ncbi:ABC transporter permease, partial [Microbacterium gubbeenense]
MSTQTTETTETAQSPLRRVLSGSVGRNLGLVLALAVIFLVGTITDGASFAGLDNILVILRQASVIGVISIGMTFVILAGGIDLSVGAVVGLASVVATVDIMQDVIVENTHWIMLVVVALATGFAAGLINGIVVAYGKVAAFMATLAMMVGARGLAELVSDNRNFIVDSSEFKRAFNVDILGVDVLIWIFVLVAAVGWIVLNRTTFGRRTIAIGGNPEAARLSGIKVKRHTMWLYSIAGLCAGIAGVMMLARTTAGTSTHGNL